MTIFYVSVIGHLSFNDMSYFMVDVEADGPVPGLYSMVSLAAVLVKPGLEERFYAELRPISDQFDPEALAVPGFTREQTLAFADPGPVVADFQKWVTERSKGRAFFISDNNGFDYMFVCWYLHQFTATIPSTTVRKTWAASTKDSWATCSRTSSTCARRPIPTMPSTTPWAMPKRCWLLRSSTS
jgi:DNA polymerase III epsilon subunit-like protein